MQLLWIQGLQRAPTEGFLSGSRFYSPLGKFREEFKAAFSCHCYGHGQNQTTRTRSRASTDSRKSLSTQVHTMDNVSRISDQVV